MPVSKERTLRFSDVGKKKHLKRKCYFGNGVSNRIISQILVTLSAVTVEAVDKNAALQTKPLILTHLTASGDNSDYYFSQKSEEHT
jgi:hypothetical protein